MTTTIAIRSADWVSATAKIHWRTNPCKGAKLLNGMNAEAFYEASFKSQSYCLRCASRAHGELMKEGKA